MPTATQAPESQPSPIRTLRPRRTRRPRVVVVGAGFGGLSAARELGNTAADVLVLDRNNYSGFWPFLYQVATGILETQGIARPVRAILRRQRNVDFRMADVQCVDLDARAVLTDRSWPTGPCEENFPASTSTRPEWCW